MSDVQGWECEIIGCHNNAIASIWRRTGNKLIKILVCEDHRGDSDGD